MPFEIGQEVEVVSGEYNVTRIGSRGCIVEIFNILGGGEHASILFQRNDITGSRNVFEGGRVSVHYTLPVRDLRLIPHAGQTPNVDLGNLRVGDTAEILIDHPNATGLNRGQLVTVESIGIWHGHRAVRVLADSGLLWEISPQHAKKVGSFVSTIVSHMPRWF